MDGDSEPVSFSVGRSKRYTVAFSPTGDHLVVGFSEFGENGWQGVFQLVDVDSGAGGRMATLPQPLVPHTARFSTDGSRIAIGTDEGVILWDVANWTKVADLKGRVYYGESIAFSPDSRLVASGSTDGTVRFWNGNSGALIYLKKTHLDTIHSIDFSPNGRYLATVSSDRTVRLWDVVGQREFKVLKGHAAAVFAVAFAPDGETLVSGGYDGVTKFWDVGADIEHARGSRVGGGR